MTGHITAVTGRYGNRIPVTTPDYNNLSSSKIRRTK